MYFHIFLFPFLIYCKGINAIGCPKIFNLFLKEKLIWLISQVNVVGNFALASTC